MAETATDDKKAKRKPKARHKEVVIGAIEERLLMCETGPHTQRIIELLDELRRSLGKTEENGE